MKKSWNKALILIAAFSLTIFSCKKNVDTTKPVIKLNGATVIYLTVGSVYEEFGFVALDNIDGDISKRVVVDYSDFDSSKPGVYTIVYRVRDNAGNESELVSRSVVVGNNFAPEIELLGENPVVLNVGEEYVEAGFSARDLDGNDLSDRVTSDVAVSLDTSTPGTYQISYTIYDQLGQYSQKVRVVYVLYNDTPIVVLKGKGVSPEDPMLYDRQDPNPKRKDPGWNAFDRKDGDLTLKVVANYDYDYKGDGTGVFSAAVQNPSVSPDEIFQIEYTVTDSDGNSSEPVYRYCKVVPDATPPVLTLKGAIEVSVEVDQVIDNFVEPGVIFTDNMDASFEAASPVDNGAGKPKIYIDYTRYDYKTITKNHPKYGDGYRVDYWAEDSNGNSSAKISRYIIVKDTTPPVISTAQTSVSYAATGYYAPAVTDNSGENIVAVLVSGESYDSRKVGTYNLTYRAMDVSGNIVEATVPMVVSAPQLNKGISNGNFETAEGLPNDIQDNYDAGSGKGKAVDWNGNIYLYARGSFNNYQYSLSQYGAAGPYWDPNCTKGKRFHAYVCNSSYLSSNYGLSGVSGNGFLFTEARSVGTLFWFARTWGTLSQSGFRVYKDVTYTLKASIANSSSNNADDSGFIEVEGSNMIFTSGGTTHDGVVRKSTSTKNNSFEVVSLDFTPSTDGTITCFIGKKEVAVADGRDGGWTVIDNVSLSIKNYPRK